RVATAQADELLVALVDGPAERAELRGRGGEGRPHGVVAARAVLLDAGESVLVPGVDRGRAGDGEQDRERVVEVARLGEAAGDAGDVVVADEGLRDEVAGEVRVAAQRVLELPGVAVVEGAP